MNIFKIKISTLICLLLFTLISCSSEIHFSGVNEKKFDQINEDYKLLNYSKDEIINIIGPPMVKEYSDDLWIYRLKKEKGNLTIKNTIYNKTLKLKFKNNILESIEEINLN